MQIIDELRNFCKMNVCSSVFDFQCFTRWRSVVRNQLIKYALAFHNNGLRIRVLENIHAGTPSTLCDLEGIDRGLQGMPIMFW